MKLLKQTMITLLVLQLHAMAKESLTDAEMLAKCDVNGNGKIDNFKESLCKKTFQLQKAEEGLNKAEEKGKKLDEDITKLEQKILKNIKDR